MNFSNDASQMPSLTERATPFEKEYFSKLLSGGADNSMTSLRSNVFFLETKSRMESRDNRFKVGVHTCLQLLLKVTYDSP